MTPRPHRSTALRLATGLAVLLAVCATPVASQELPPPRPDAASGLQLQRLVERWLEVGSIDGRRGEPLEASGVLGVRVTLRNDGYLMGTGTAWVRPEVLRPRLAEITAGKERSPEDPPADLLVLTQDAAVDAFRDTVRTLEEAAAKARELGRAPRLQGVEAVPKLEEVADRLQVDVQIAYAAEAVRAPAAGAEGAGPAERFVSGFHGLLALPGDPNAEPVAEWPATSLAYNLRPRLQLNRVALGLGLTLVDADSPGRPGGPPLFRFEVVHAVRPARGLDVRVLERGNVPLPRNRLDAATLSDLGSRLATHLATHYPAAGPVRGTWHPESGRYEPSLANLEDAAFGAFALAAHDRFEAERAEARGLHPPPRVSTRIPGWLAEIAAALDMPDAQARAMVGGGGGVARPAAEPAAAALLTLARLESNGGAADPISRRFAADLADRCVGGEVRKKPGAEGDAGGAVSPTVRAMAAYALGRHALADADAEQAEACAAVLAGIWGDGDRAGSFAGLALPWLGRAAAEVGPGLVAQGLLEAEELDQRRAVLMRVLPLLQDAQVISRPADAPGDGLGGFLLRPPAPGGFADPDWHTAPLLEFLSLGLNGFGGGSEAAPGQTGLLIATGSASRFLAQLSMAAPSLYYARSPQNAVGGLRVALDDSRLPIGPTASGLLAVDALERALAELATGG